MISAGGAAIAVIGVSSLSGDVVANGTVTAKTGISIANSTIHGQVIANGGDLSGGLTIDNRSEVVTTGASIGVSSTTFTGGITNAGTVLATVGTAVSISSVTRFG